MKTPVYNSMNIYITINIPINTLFNPPKTFKNKFKTSN